MRRSYVVEIIFNLLLLLLFVGCSFVILFLGVQQYQRSLTRNELMQNQRMPFAYLTTKVHQSVGLDMDIAMIDDLAIYQIHETINDKEYVTSIYCVDGYLMESFTSKDGFDFSAGNRICPLNQLTVYLDSRSVSFELCNDGQCDTLHLKR